LSPAASSIALSSIIQPRYTGGRKPARFERSGELRDDAPFGRRGRTGQRKRERVLDGQGGLGSHRCTLQFRWAKRDHGTCTYVNSRRLSLRECYVNPRIYYGFHGFDSRWGRLKPPCFGLDHRDPPTVASRLPRTAAGASRAARYSRPPPGARWRAAHRHGDRRVPQPLLNLAEWSAADRKSPGTAKSTGQRSSLRGLMT